MNFRQMGEFKFFFVTLHPVIQAGPFPVFGGGPELYLDDKLPAVLLPADDVVPLEVLDGGVPVGLGGLVGGSGEEHTD